MTHLHTRSARRTAQRAARDARKALAKEMAAYSSPSELIELSEILARHDDAETEELRRLIDWTAAA